MVCVDPKDIPVVAFVDPEMMSSMPKGLTAATGMDALTHAIEGYITAAAWELSDMFHLKAQSSEQAEYCAMPVLSFFPQIMNSVCSRKNKTIHMSQMSLRS